MNAKQAREIAADVITAKVAEIAEGLAERHPGTTPEQWIGKATDFTLDVIARDYPQIFDMYARTLIEEGN